MAQNQIIDKINNMVQLFIKRNRHKRSDEKYYKRKMAQNNNWPNLKVSDTKTKIKKYKKTNFLFLLK